MMDLFIDVLVDSVKDTAQLIPFLLVTYLAMEALEHSAGNRMEELVSRAGAAGPAVGAALGAVPQCGFSAMAATLFSGRVITIGTLVAVVAFYHKLFWNLIKEFFRCPVELVHLLLELFERLVKIEIHQITSIARLVIRRRHGNVALRRVVEPEQLRMIV